MFFFHDLDFLFLYFAFRKLFLNLDFLFLYFAFRKLFLDLDFLFLYFAFRKLFLNLDFLLLHFAFCKVRLLGLFFPCFHFTFTKSPSSRSPFHTVQLYDLMRRILPLRYLPASSPPMPYGHYIPDMPALLSQYNPQNQGKS